MSTVTSILLLMPSSSDETKNSFFKYVEKSGLLGRKEPFVEVESRTRKSRHMQCQMYMLAVNGIDGGPERLIYEFESASWSAEVRPYVQLLVKGEDEDVFTMHMLSGTGDVNEL